MKARILILFLAMCMALGGTAFAYDGSAPVTEEDDVISLLTSNSGSQLTEWETMPWITALIEKSGVNLDIEIIETNIYADVMKPRLAAGIDLADIVQIPDFDSDLSYIKTGYFIDLTELYDEYGFNINQYVGEGQRYAQVKRQFTTPDGSIYYFPHISLGFTWQTALQLNTMWLEEINYEEPMSLDAFYDMLVAFKTGDPNGNGEADEVPLFINGTEYMRRMGSWWGIDLSGSGYTAGEDGTLYDSYTSEAYREFLGFAHTLYSEELINLDFASTTSDIFTTLCTNGRIGSLIHFIGNSGTYSSMLDANWTSDGALLMQPVPPIAVPDHESVYFGRSSAGNRTFAITKTCERPDIAFSFLDYCVSDESLRLRYIGREEDNLYTIDDDGAIHLDITKWSAPGFAGSMGYNFYGFPEMQDNVYKEATRAPGAVEAAQLIVDYTRNNAIASTFYLQDEVEVIEIYNADYQTYKEEMLVAFVIGTKSIDEFDAYVEQCKALGSDELLEVYSGIYARLS